MAKNEDNISIMNKYNSRIVKIDFHDYEYIFILQLMQDVFSVSVDLFLNALKRAPVAVSAVKRIDTPTGEMSLKIIERIRQRKMGDSVQYATGTKKT